MVEQNIARIDYKSKEGINYLQLLNGSEQKVLIVPGIERDLTDSSRKVVTDTFRNSLNIGRIVNIVRNVRQGNPDLSELDAFVYDAADVVYTQCSDKLTHEIDVRECRMLMPRLGTYLLSGIYVLREANTQRLLEINPQGAPRDQC